MPFCRLAVFTIFCFAPALLVGCGGDQDGSAPTASLSGGSADSEGGVSPVAAKGKLADPLRPVVMVETTAGSFTIQLDAQAAPGTVSNFLDYVGSGFYAGTTFHYVNAESMILGGGHTADGSEKTASGLQIRNEAHNGLKNVRGAVAMNRFPDAIDSATCQFFVNVRDNPDLNYRAGGDAAPGLGNVSSEDYGYCVFGRVTKGMDVVDQIAALPTRQDGPQAGAPTEAVVIRSIRLVR